jgi:hypothetical protein
MPQICEFFGIVIYLYFSEHNPPHFHAIYAEHEAEFDFNGSLVNGKFPPRAAGLVTEWALQRKRELSLNWTLASKKKTLRKIKPLE